MEPNFILGAPNLTGSENNVKKTLWKKTLVYGEKNDSGGIFNGSKQRLAHTCAQL
jgi:hypothetical protein